MGPHASLPVGASAHGLPIELTPFIGRERELAALRELTAGARLVTLTGAGGSGKTRLALELATGDAATLPVYWVELAPLRDPEHVVPAVAEAVGLRGEARTGEIAKLTRLLTEVRARVVLDNCEHLVDAAAELADRLLRECPAISILATSREALGVRGERAWLVPPLSIPAAGVTDGIDRCEAVRLFVERARDVVPDFAITRENAGAIAEICRRLEGIPLAIELAAARTKVLSAADIRDRLDDAFRLLASGGRTATPRHRTLRAGMDWSHDLLDEEGRVLFRRLAVFRGGMSLDGAEAVGAGGDLSAASILELLAKLVDRSLLDVREHHGATRYAYLEVVRQYATEKLTAAGEDHAVRARHADFYLALVEEAEPHFTRTERRVWVDRMLVDLDNLRSALSWSLTHAPTLHTRMVGKLWWFWFSTQYWTEGGRWIRGALALPEAAAASPERAALLFAAGALTALQVRSAEARAYLEEAVALARSLDDERLEAYARNYLGMTYAGEGKAAEAVEHCGHAERWFRANGDLYGLRLASLLLGSAALGRGDLEEAERWNKDGVQEARVFGQNRELAVSLQNLAAVYLVQRRLDEAEALIREAMAASRLDPSLYFIATGVGYQGEIEAARNRPTAAARFLGAAEGIRDRIGATAFPLDARRQESATASAREQLGTAAFDAAWAEGRAMDTDTLLAELAAETTDGARAGDGEPAAPAEAASGPVRVVDRPAVFPSAGTVDLRVAALGPLAVDADGTALPAERWVYAKPRELLVYLLVTPGGGTRDQIGTALWPDAARAKVKNSFHVTLHHLRKTLGHPEWVITEADRYRLAPQIRYAFDGDVLEAQGRTRLRGANGSGRQAAPDPEALREVLALYRGDLLEGEPAGRWVDAYRDRYRRVQVELSLALGSLLDEASPDEAADLYHRLALREELDEEIHRRLMAAWHRAGNRAGALRHYERVAELLRDELDAEPEPETVALYERIRGG